MAKTNRKGRSKSGPRFTQVYHYLQDSVAWLDCTPAERAVYLEIAKLYNGGNNGALGFSGRTAAERCNINRETAYNAFRGLTARGLIECATPSRFTRKTRHAPEWRLTCERCDVTGALPSKAFLRWRRADPKSSHSDLKHGTEIGPDRDPDSSHSAALKPPSGRNGGPVNDLSAASSVRNEGPHIDLHHVGGCGEPGDQAPAVVAIPDTWRALPWSERRRLASNFALVPLRSASEVAASIEAELMRRRCG
jgi:hypothetical protein